MIQKKCLERIRLTTSRLSCLSREVPREVLSLTSHRSDSGEVPWEVLSLTSHQMIQKKCLERIRLTNSRLSCLSGRSALTSVKWRRRTRKPNSAKLCLGSLETCRDPLELVLLLWMFIEGVVSNHTALLFKNAYSLTSCDVFRESHSRLNMHN